MCAHTRALTHTHSYTHTRACTRTCAHPHTQASMHAHTHAHACARTHARSRARAGPQLLSLFASKRQTTRRHVQLVGEWLEVTVERLWQQHAGVVAELGVRAAFSARRAGSAGSPASLGSTQGWAEERRGGRLAVWAGRAPMFACLHVAWLWLVRGARKGGQRGGGACRLCGQGGHRVCMWLVCGS